MSRLGQGDSSCCHVAANPRLKSDISTQPCVSSSWSRNPCILLGDTTHYYTATEVKWYPKDGDLYELSWMFMLAARTRVLSSSNDESHPRELVSTIFTKQVEYFQAPRHHWWLYEIATSCILRGTRNNIFLYARANPGTACLIDCTSL